MYPHERSLVQAMENKPFVLLGVNSDQTKEIAKKAIEDEKLTWRSFWNGGSTQGPISNAWKVTGWPTIYVLDAEGTIRYREVRGEAMDHAVDALLAELDGGKKK